MKMAVIPARGGSKRIPKKNIKLFYGKPMIAWSIETAKKSELFEKIIVSTDDENIAEVATKYGAEVPFLRPAELSDDMTGTAPVMAHAIRWAKMENLDPALVCCIYATAPFMLPSDLIEGSEAMESGQWKFAFTATNFAAPIFRSFKRLPSGGIEMIFPEHFSTRSQDLPETYHDAGQSCWGTANAWLQNDRIFDVHAFPVLLPRWRVLDIDTLEDWVHAEQLAPSIMGDLA